MQVLLQNKLPSCPPSNQISIAEPLSFRKFGRTSNLGRICQAFPGLFVHVTKLPAHRDTLYLNSWAFSREPNNQKSTDHFPLKEYPFSGLWTMAKLAFSAGIWEWEEIRHPRIEISMPTSVPHFYKPKYYFLHCWSLIRLTSQSMQRQLRLEAYPIFHFSQWYQCQATSWKVSVSSTLCPNFPDRELESDGNPMRS